MTDKWVWLMFAADLQADLYNLRRTFDVSLGIVYTLYWSKSYCCQVAMIALWLTL